MPDPPELHLGNPPPGLIRRTGSGPGIRVLICVQLITLVGIGLLFMRSPAALHGTTVLSGQAAVLRTTALALEDRGLSMAAASSWQDLLRLSPDADDRAQIHYRIGRLLMQAEDYRGAAAALVEAELQVTEEDSLNGKIGPQIVECLRRLGRYGEVGRELSRQVEVGSGQSTKESVLATFAGESLTEADLDRMIENRVDRIIAMQPEGGLPASRQQLLQQYQSADLRQRILQEILQTELFSRRARELKIDQEDAFRQARDSLQTELLASRFLTRQLETIQPTDVDVESFYTARRSDYHQPETVTVLVFPAQDDPSAETDATQIQSVDEFRKQAEQVSGKAGLVPLRLIRGQSHPRLGDTSGVFELAAGEWTRTPIEAGGERLWVLIESKTPAAVPPLSQIRFRVEADYGRIKRQELTQQLSRDLMSRYDVKILAEPPVVNSAGGAGQEAASVIGAGTADDPATEADD